MFNVTNVLFKYLIKNLMCKNVSATMRNNKILFNIWKMVYFLLFIFIIFKYNDIYVVITIKISWYSRLTYNKLFNIDILSWNKYWTFYREQHGK